MNWLALGPAQVAAIWAGLSAVAVWLYLHHRRPLHKKVSTLRFWASVQAVSQPRRRKLREPWALLAQVLFLLFLLLALANPRWGGLFEARSVVIVFDASIWSQAHPAGEIPWIDRERAQAIRLLDSLPSRDRVLLLRAEADAPPVVPFTTDHAAVRNAIEEIQPSSAAADVPRALEIGKAALSGTGRGVLAYVGPGMLDDEQVRGLEKFRADLEAPQENGDQPQFLIRLVQVYGPPQNRGITRLSLRRDVEQPNRWHLLTQLKNYNSAKASISLKFSVDGQPLGQRQVSLGPGELANKEDDFVWDKGGLLKAEIEPSDALDSDNRAVVSLPTFRTIHAALFVNGQSRFAASLLSVLSINPYVRTQIVPSGTTPGVSPDVAIYQGANPPAAPSYNSIIFVGGPGSSSSRSLRVIDWNAQHPVTRWVRTHDVSVRNPASIPLQASDTVLAYTEGNPPTPLMVAREQNGHRMLIVGFDPQESNFPLDSAFPLLMAGGMEWMTHSVEEVAGSLSTGELEIPGPVTRIIRPSGRDLPFARQGSNVRLLALETGVYRVIAPSGENTLAVNAPLLPSQQLKVTDAEAAGVESEALRPEGLNLWRWFVLLAIVALWLEWWLYYRSRERQRVAEICEISMDGSKQNAHQEFDLRSEPDTRERTVAARIMKG